MWWVALRRRHVAARQAGEISSIGKCNAPTGRIPRKPEPIPTQSRLSQWTGACWWKPLAGPLSLSSNRHNMWNQSMLWKNELEASVAVPVRRGLNVMFAANEFLRVLAGAGGFVPDA